MASALIQRIFRRREAPPLVCAVSLGEDGHPIAEDPNHVHGPGCFIELEPLAIVELFQSQSCVSCPPALPGIHDAANHPNLLLLSHNVTIFDHLGWKDTHATSVSDQRHRAYAKKWMRNRLFTPQVVVNGSADGSGAGGKDDVAGIVQSARANHNALGFHVNLDANDTDLRIDTDKAESEPYDVLLIAYNDGDEVVKIGKGPNKGNKMKHRNVVNSITKVGTWTGGDLTLPLPSPAYARRPGEAAVAVVQGPNGGQIIAATKV